MGCKATRIAELWRTQDQSSLLAESMHDSVYLYLAGEGGMFCGIWCTQGHTM